MAFPSVQARTVWQGAASNATSHSVTMPGSISAGDLLICVFSVDGNPTCTASGNWTKLGQASNSTVVTGAVFWKIASGSDTLTVTTSVAEQASAITYRITGGYYVTGASANGSSTNSNPPSSGTPSDSTQDYLFIATRSGDSTVVATVAPTNYSNLTTQAAAGTGGASTNVADRTLNTSSAQDPGTFTSATEQWVSWTLCVSPVQTDTTISPSSDTIAVGETVDLTANVKRNSVNSAGETVTAASSDTTKAVAFAVSGTNTVDVSAYSALGELTYTTPGGTSPSGATIRRFAETTANAQHIASWYFALSSPAASDRRYVRMEVRSTRDTIRFDQTGAGQCAASIRLSTPTTNETSGTGTIVTSRPLGSDWYEVTLYNPSVADTSGALYVVAVTESGGTFTQTYTGDTGQYFELGAVTVSRGASTGGTTDASGNCTVRVLGVASGSANVTATALYDTSSDSAITVSSGASLNAEAGSYTLTGSTATLVAQRALNAEAGLYSLAGSAATLARQIPLDAAAGSYSVAGADAALQVARVLDASAGGYTLTGAAATLLASRVLVADAGTYAVTGASASLVRVLPLAADAGAYAITGAAAELLYQGVKTLNAEAGVYSLSGADAGLQARRVLHAESGGSTSGLGAAPLPSIGLLLGASGATYQLAGADATLTVVRALSADAGAYALTGADADLTKIGAASLNAEAGAYTLTGAQAAVVAQRSLAADAGSYALTGAAATLQVARALDAQAGAYAVTGADAELVVQGITAIDAQAGVYAIGGAAAALVVERRMDAAPGSYALDGAPAGFDVGRVLTAESGAYAIDGAAADLEYIGSDIEASVPLQTWRVRGMERGHAIESSARTQQTGAARAHDVRSGSRTRRTGANRTLDVTQ